MYNLLFVSLYQNIFMPFIIPLKNIKHKIMRNFWLVLILAVIVSGFSACKSGSNGESAINNVPENAAAVVAINLKNLMDKADLDAVKKMDFYQDMIAEAAKQQGETMAKVLENPEKSGIDLTQNAYFFADMEGQESNGLVGFVFKITDEKQFEALVKSSDITLEKGNNFQFGTSNESVVAWNSSTGFIGSITNSYDESENVVIQLDKVFNAKKSIANNSKATKALDGKHDVNYYFSTSSIVDMFGDQLEMGEFFISKEDLKNNSFTGYTDFNKGTIESFVYSDLSKGLKSDLKMIFAEGSKTDFSPYILKENLVTLVTGKLNFKGINQLLKDKNVSGLVDMQLNGLGLKTDDIVAAIDGDMAIAMNMKPGSDDPSMIMMMKINDKKKLEMILAKAEKMGLFTKLSDGLYSIGGRGLGMSLGLPSGKILIQKDVLIYSNDMVTLKKLEKGALSKSESVSSLIYKNASGVFGMFMDYEGLAKGIGELSSMSPMNMGGNVKTMETSINWDKSTSKMTMKNQSQNALKSLMESANDSYLKNKDNREEMQKQLEEYEKTMEEATETEEIEM
jgi:hypothetical protein